MRIKLVNIILIVAGLCLSRDFSRILLKNIIIP